MTGAMTTSWDDGHPSDVRIADLLARFGLDGTFYIPRRAPNIVMPDDDIRRLSQQFEIGAHTLTHPRLTTVNESQAREEIVGSKYWVEALTGKTCVMFCPPEGKFLTLHRAIARDAGYRGFRTVELLSLDSPSMQDGLKVMPTSVQAQPHLRTSYLKNITKRRSIRGLMNYARAGAAADWTVLAKRMISRAARVGGVFHLWGHSWEVDQFAQWAALESVLAFMSEHKSDLASQCNSQLL